jgi:SPP1 family phage portal protein
MGRETTKDNKQRSHVQLRSERMVQDIGYTNPIYNTRLGRAEIYTNEPYITKDNLIDVLSKAKSTHMLNVVDIKNLLRYEKGDQGLPRVKKVRPDIDIQDIDNIANQITEFKLGYDWGYPISLIQRGQNDKNNSDSIAKLHDFYELAGSRGIQQELARFVEICGIGYTYIDLNNDYVEGESPFTLDVLDPEFTFVVKSLYYPDKRIVMGVTYGSTDEEGDTTYTCFTPSSRFVVDKNNTITEFANYLGIIPIVEWIRAYDRMGCFERQIPEMDALNLLNSDFLNDVDQNTQAIWHVNDVEFAKEEYTDDEGNVITKIKRPENGQWLQTFTNSNGSKPSITPLTVNYNYSGVLNNIVNKRQTILQKCDVPQRNDNSGGSTGIAMSDASGWSAAEASASKKENIQDLCKCQELRVVFRTIKKCTKISADDPIKQLSLADVKPYIKRQKSYEMTVKTNAFATMVAHGINGLDAIQSINFFDDPSEVWERSKDTIEKYQEKTFGEEPVQEQIEVDNELSSDRVTDQIENSPNID